MSRRTLSFFVGGLGLIAAFATLIGMEVMGSLQADARTENIAGPGVDLFLRTPFPLPGSELTLDVAARGGSQAGVNLVMVSDGETTLATERGRGVTWGSVISDKSRGNAETTLRFALPSRLGVGDTLHLTVDVDYVCAMSSATTFTNESRHDVVPIDVRVRSSSESLQQRLLLGARGLGLLGLWFALVWGVTYLFTTSTGVGDGAMEGNGLLMGFMGGGLLGYWFFARPLMAAWELTATFWAVALTALWLVLPPLYAWRWTKQHKKLSRFRLRPAEPRIVEVDARDVTSWLPAGGELEVRQRGQTISARRQKARLRVRWSGLRFPLDQLVIEATDVRLPLELAHHAAARLGKLILSPSTGPTLLVDPARSVDEIQTDYTAAIMAEASRVLDALRARVSRR